MLFCGRGAGVVIWGLGIRKERYGYGADVDRNDADAKNHGLSRLGLNITESP